MCRCWDDLESRLWWIIKTPILLSIFVSTLHLFTWIAKTKQCDHRKHSGNTSFSVVCVWFDPQTNFAIFLNISRIIVQKTKSTHVMQTEPQPYRWAPTHLFLHPSLPVSLWPSCPLPPSAGRSSAPLCCSSLCSVCTTWCSLCFQNTSAWSLDSTSS